MTLNPAKARTLFLSSNNRTFRLVERIRYIVRFDAAGAASGSPARMLDSTGEHGSTTWHIRIGRDGSTQHLRLLRRPSLRFPQRLPIRFQQSAGEGKEFALFPGQLAL